MKKIAVLLASYNGEKYIKTQIDSILNQKCNVELTLIIRDDGSTDNTINILDEYKKDNRVIVIKGKNVGPARGFLELLKYNTDYDYYAFSDQDDVWFSNKIQEGINMIEKCDNVPLLYFSNANLVDNNLNSIGRLVHNNCPPLTLESVLCISTTAQGCTSIINKELAKIIQERDIPNNIIMHDTYITSVCMVIGGKVLFDERPYMNYRMHNNNDTGMPTKEQLGILNMAIVRLKYIFTKREVSMSTQALMVYKLFEDQIDKNALSTIKLVINSNNNLLCRIKLVLNRNLLFESLSTRITFKLKILFGNN